ncbi:hypothetical protein CS022_07200 [Veronia nyctiphanis]|uniref:Uncharacterized protein n=1 Tax=Veronia nyctiphanis TaxID=1278244 RepID=A0A4Q0YSW3_9GAMM|nr:DUF6482 family protein [Veronia nyctiphanis]RXJ73785.1 hypothetical protein CS022_07200 [Veronia nyctiphanis]
MKLKQLKYWIQSHPEDIPHCYIVAHAGGVQYMVEVEVKGQLEPLRDDHDQMMHFETIERVSDSLRKLGIEKVTLRLMDPYDEFGPATPATKEDMEIRL